MKGTQKLGCVGHPKLPPLRNSVTLRVEAEAFGLMLPHVAAIVEFDSEKHPMADDLQRAIF